MKYSWQSALGCRQLSFDYLEIGKNWFRAIFQSSQVTKSLLSSRQYSQVLDSIILRFDLESLEIPFWISRYSTLVTLEEEKKKLKDKIGELEAELVNRNEEAERFLERKSKKVTRSHMKWCLKSGMHVNVLYTSIRAKFSIGFIFQRCENVHSFRTQYRRRGNSFKIKSQNYVVWNLATMY